MKRLILNNFHLHTITSITEIYRNKADGILIHAGLKLQLQNGRHLIFHSLPGKGPHLADMNDFLDNNRLIYLKKHTKNIHIMKSRIEKIISERKSYSPLYNCEHLVTDVIHGEKNSPQLKSILIGTAVGAGMGYSLYKNKPVAAIFCGLIFGYLYLQHTNKQNIRIGKR